MRNLKLFLAIALCLGAISTASAQLTTGKPTSSTIRTGNRPGAGSYGLYFGATSNMFRDVFNSDVSMKSLPLINLKYMNTNQVEWRLGIEIYKSNEYIKGDTNGENNSTITGKNRFKESQAALYPGIAYHFSPTNILDVYCGVEVPFGWNRLNNISEYSAKNQEQATSTQKNAFFFGLGGFIGLQAFIATNGSKTQTSYTLDSEQFKHLEVNSYDTYSKLNARKGEIGSQFRLTLSYYFK